MRLAVVILLAGCAVAGEEGVMGSALDTTTRSGGGYGLARCPQQGTVYGVDVSQYQGAIDWPRAHAAGVQFAYVRVSDGLAVRDALFERNWSAAQGAAVVRGAYQFFRPSEDAMAQADLLVDAIGTPAGDLPPVLDVEIAEGVDPHDLALAVHAWSDRVVNRLGVFPIVYTGATFWHDEVGNAPGGANPLWIADDAACPTVPTAWTGWSFWQSARRATVPGIDMPIDVDQFNGAPAGLAALAH